MIRGAYSVIVWQRQNDRVALAWRSGTRRTGKPVVLANTRGGRQAPHTTVGRHRYCNEATAVHDRLTTKQPPSDRRAARQMKRGKQTGRKKESGQTQPKQPNHARILRCGRGRAAQREEI